MTASHLNSNACLATSQVKSFSGINLVDYRNWMTVKCRK